MLCRLECALLLELIAAAAAAQQELAKQMLQQANELLAIDLLSGRQLVKLSIGLAHALTLEVGTCTLAFRRTLLPAFACHEANRCGDEDAWLDDCICMMPIFLPCQCC
jgi:hypothetical protein